MKRVSNIFPAYDILSFIIMLGIYLGSGPLAKLKVHSNTQHLLNHPNLYVIIIRRFIEIYQFEWIRYISIN